MCIKIDKTKQSALPRFSLPIVKKDRALPFADSSKFLKNIQKIFCKNKKVEENKKKIIFYWLYE